MSVGFPVYPRTGAGRKQNTGKQSTGTDKCKVLGAGECVAPGSASMFTWLSSLSQCPCRFSRGSGPALLVSSLLDSSAKSPPRVIRGRSAGGSGQSTEAHSSVCQFMWQSSVPRLAPSSKKVSRVGGRDTEAAALPCP